MTPYRPPQARKVIATVHKRASSLATSAAAARTLRRQMPAKEPHTSHVGERSEATATQAADRATEPQTAGHSLEATTARG